MITWFSAAWVRIRFRDRAQTAKNFGTDPQEEWIMSIRKATREYKAVNGCSIKADIFLPSHETPPVVLYFHGGALISGSRSYLPSWQVKRLLQAGIAVASFDYRLAPETKLAEIITDIQDAIHWVKGEGRTTYGFDAERVAAMGSSAGGYLSLLTGTFEKKPNAIVAFYGYGDILGDWYTRPSEYYCKYPIITREEAESQVGGAEKSSGDNLRYSFYFYCRQQGIWPEAVSGDDPIADREKLLRYCPVYNIGPTYPPTLLLHGDQDHDVPYEQSQQMSIALEKQGIENQLITIKGAGHGFDGDGKYPEVKQVFENVVTFLQDHL
jgi:acetyl esterase/lipase